MSPYCKLVTLRLLRQYFKFSLIIHTTFFILPLPSHRQEWIPYSRPRTGDRKLKTSWKVGRTRWAARNHVDGTRIRCQGEKPQNSRSTSKIGVWPRTRLGPGWGRVHVRFLGSGTKGAKVPWYDQGIIRIVVPSHQTVFAYIIHILCSLKYEMLWYFRIFLLLLLSLPLLLLPLLLCSLKFGRWRSPTKEYFTRRLTR